MPASEMNATRFPLPPVKQPVYQFAHVPAAKRDLTGSTLHRVTDRHEWQGCLGELGLLCKEAVRRRRQKSQATANAINADNAVTTTNTINATSATTTASKPLSLEYLADRSDVDEPLWGYMVRHEGRLQGFITVTTFTNYHPTFCWDSLHPAAFDESEADSHHVDTQANGRASQRQVDSNGRLAQELQGTARAGGIHEEGIVWPRLAEISLLGALGCGRTLVQLVLEDLQRLSPTPVAHYDYVVLQATDNSIRFYESLGFVRVGALTAEDTPAGAMGSPRRPPLRAKPEECTPNDNDHNHDESDHQESDDDEEETDWGSPTKKKTKVCATPTRVARATVPNQAAATAGWIAGPAIEDYKTKKPGETPTKIAQHFRVNAYDIVFLNQRVYPDLTVHSRLKAQTSLKVPKVLPKETSRQRPMTEVQWYTAKENDTPRFIARMFDVSTAQIVQANKSRLPGLLSNSRLKQGTRVRITAADDNWQAYSHWAFPDDEFEEGEPSYMMALKLTKPRGKATQARPVLESLAVEVADYEVSPLLRDVTAPLRPTSTAPVLLQDSLSTLHIPPAPVRPLEPPVDAFGMYVRVMRRKKESLLQGKSPAESNALLRQAYEMLSEEQCWAFKQKSVVLQQEYVPKKLAYEEALAVHRSQYPEVVAPSANLLSRPPIATEVKPTDLFNKVVRLCSGAPEADGRLDVAQYWYVLTYIPDLQWCHLAPMLQKGIYGDDKARAAGRPKYKLADEALGWEVDISSTYCIPVKAVSMKKTADADREEWDVRDDGTEPSSRRRSSMESVSSVSSYRVASKPSAVVKDRKRKLPSLSNTSVTSFTTGPAVLEAILPGTQQRVRVILKQQERGRPPKNPGLSTTTGVPPIETAIARRSSNLSTTSTTSEASTVTVGSDSDRRRPKRLSAPSYLGESPVGSPRVRQGSLRGRSPGKC